MRAMEVIGKGMKGGKKGRKNRIWMDGGSEKEVKGKRREEILEEKKRIEG